MITTLFTHAAKLSASSRLETIVTTLGSHGVLLGTRDLTFKHFKALPLDEKLVKSAVGAGDSFMGGYIYGIYNEKTREECVEYGQICARASLQSEKHVSKCINESILK